MSLKQIPRWLTSLSAFWRIAACRLVTSGSGADERKDCRDIQPKEFHAVKVTGVDRIIEYRDVAADDGKVLEIDLPHGETKVIHFEIR